MLIHQWRLQRRQRLRPPPAERTVALGVVRDKDNSVVGGRTLAWASVRECPLSSVAPRRHGGHASGRINGVKPPPRDPPGHATVGGLPSRACLRFGAAGLVGGEGDT